mgnify:CR=1 FL=1
MKAKRIRKTKHDYDIELITELINEGWYIEEIEKSLGYSKESLRKHLEKNYRKMVKFYPLNDPILQLS